MTWEDLSEEEKESWNKFYDKFNNLINLFNIIKTRGCFLCSKKPKTFFEFQFHIKSTHGINEEILELIIKKGLKL